MRTLGLTLACATIIGVMGCSNAGAPAPGSDGTTAGGATGSLRLSFAWPEGPELAMIPESTATIDIRITKGGETTKEATVPRGQSEVTLEEVEVGESIVRGQAKKGDGTVVAEGEAAVTIKPVDTVTVSLVLEPLVGDIFGVVRDLEDLPIPEARVETSAGATVFSATTDENGAYRLEDVDGGYRVVTFSALNYSTEFQTTVVAGEEVELNAQLEVCVSTIDVPIITLDGIPDTEASCSAQLSGTIGNLDCGTDFAVLILNGDESIITVAEDGSFSQSMSLANGGNRLRVRAVNSRGSAQTQEYLVHCGNEHIYRATFWWGNPQGEAEMYTFVNGGAFMWTQTARVSGGIYESNGHAIEGPDGYGYGRFVYTAYEHQEYGGSVPDQIDHDLGIRVKRGVPGDDGREVPLTVYVRVRTGALATNSLDKTYSIGLNSSPCQDPWGGPPHTDAECPLWRPATIRVFSDGRVELVEPPVDRELYFGTFGW